MVIRRNAGTEKTELWKNKFFETFKAPNNLTAEQVKAIALAYDEAGRQAMRDQHTMGGILKVMLDALKYFIMAFAIAAYGRLLAAPASIQLVHVKHSVPIAWALYLVAAGVVLATLFVTYDAWDEKFNVGVGKMTTAQSCVYAFVYVLLAALSAWAFIYQFL